MNTKYFEHIVVYLSVLVVCVIIALFARVVALRLGVDEFTAQIVFWSVVAIGIIVYSILSILVEGLFTALVKFFFPKKQEDKTNDKKTELEKLQTELEKEKKKVILLIHPMLSSAKGMKEEIVDRIGGDYRYILPDLSAHGETRGEYNGRCYRYVWSL